MPKYQSVLLSLLACLLFHITGHAAPRILRSSNPGNDAIWVSLKKESKGQYQLTINREKQASETFKMTEDSAASNGKNLRFAKGEEARATAALKGAEDVIAHTAANDAEATGDAAGDINSFVNTIVRKDGVEGVMILPAAPAPVDISKGSTMPAWSYALIGILVGAGGGYLLSRSMKQTLQARVTIEEDKEEPLEKSTGNDGATVNDVLATDQKLKKAQKDLKDARAELKKATTKADAETAKNKELEEDYHALETRLKTANESIAAAHGQMSGLQNQLQQLQTQASRQEAYFKQAASYIIRPFTDFAGGAKINPADKISQAIVEEQIVLMAFHYYSLVRYGAGIWDEHDIYNLQLNGSPATGHKAAEPQPVPVSARSGYPNLVLTIAELLRQSGASGSGMDISIRGYRFVQSPQ